MTKQVNQFSLEEILCPNEIKNKEDEKEKLVSEDVRDLLSKVSKTIGIITFEKEIILEKSISEIEVSEIVC